ncbi:MAG: T9SS type A sorting domain-containing protein [Bacteroidota bacterium]|nr:T9SS type A sorting domain-containing protein [Bacteroidota bacterium]
MKKIYLLFIFLASLSSFQKSFSQCTCSGGTIPDSVVYNQYFDSLIATNTIISFPKFDPAIGVLTCFRVSDTVTTVVNYNLQNNQPDTESYKFRTSRLSDLTGPNNFESYTNSPNKTYGPYILYPFHSPGNTDQVDIGPDTVFNKDYSTAYGASSAAYYGTGNVDFNYLTTSTFTILTGSSNAIITLRAYTRLDIQLVYYWCPFSILATKITGFKASLSNKNVLMQWDVNNPEDLDKYEIEISTDGQGFKNYGEGNSNANGVVSHYAFTYNVDEAFSGKLFFRIKQTDQSGKVSYSNVRNISINNKNSVHNYSIYPNPSIAGINIQFKNSNNGNYNVELLNASGQSIFQKRYLINNSNSINIDWPRKPLPGIYFLKIRDLKTNIDQVERLQIM